MLNNIDSSLHIFDHYVEDDCSDDSACARNYENCSEPNCFINQVRYPDGTLKLRNLHLSQANSDFLYHLGFGTDRGLHEMFGDVKVSFTSTHCVFV